MNKIIFVVLIPLSLFLTVYPVTGTHFYNNNISLSTSNGNTLYVGGTGPNNYTMIQDAIDNAVDGDTVYVYDGIYNEIVSIKYHQINLIGKDKYNTIIEGTNNDYGIIIKISYVSVSGFTILDCKKTAIYISNPSGRNYLRDIVIRDTIIDNCENGFYISGSIDCSIYNNTILNNQIGIFIHNYGIIFIEYNDIKDNEKGIYFEESHAIIRFNNFISNVIQSTGYNCFAVNGIPPTGDFFLYTINNTWYKNYWDDWKLSIIPRPIFTITLIVYNMHYAGFPIGLIPLPKFDRNPAKEPYDI